MTKLLKGTLALAGMFALSMPAMANTVSVSGTIDGSEPTFDNPGTTATTLTSFDSYEFTVDADGTYDFLGAYAGDISLDENLDGYLLVYETFDPMDPASGVAIAASDDYSAGGIGGLAGFDADCAGSNCSGISTFLTAGTYTLVLTSFTDVPNSFGQPTGDYDLTLTGPGNITVVPVPAAVWLMMSGLAGLGFMRRK